MHDMPVGLAGLVLASIFAIAMSNASGSLNSLASSSIIDLAAGRRTCQPGAVARPLAADDARVGRVLGLLGIIRWGPVLVAGSRSLRSPMADCSASFLLGTWNRRANETWRAYRIRERAYCTMIAVRLFRARWL